MSIPRRSRLIPAASALILASLVTLRVVERAPRVDIARYMETSRAAIDGIPFRIGPYFGVEHSVTPGAVELLQPNRILQRRYTDPETGEGFSLVLVHCGIAKDMTGHYPPNCYPRSGWLSDGPSETVTLDAGGVVIPATLYHFELRQGFSPQRMDILNFFIVPSGPQRFGADIRRVEQASGSAWTSRYGAAQVQIMTTREMGPEQREAVWETVLDAMSSALFVIAEGPA
jgi:hypothetical protein